MILYTTGMGPPIRVRHLKIIISRQQGGMRELVLELVSDSEIHIKIDPAEWKDLKMEVFQRACVKELWNNFDWKTTTTVRRSLRTGSGWRL